MADRAGGGFGYHSGQPGRAPLGDDNAVGPGALRRADDCAEVVRIFDPVKDDHKGSLPSLFCQREDVLHAGVVRGSAYGNNPLVYRARSHIVELFGVDLDHRDPFGFRFFDDLGGGRLVSALCRHDLDDGTVGVDRFDDRISAD